MIEELKEVEGVKNVLGLDSIVGPGIPRDFLPQKLTGDLESDDYKLLLVMSEYKVASDEVNAQCSSISKIIKSYANEGWYHYRENEQFRPGCFTTVLTSGPICRSMKINMLLVMAMPRVIALRSSCPMVVMRRSLARTTAKR